MKEKSKVELTKKAPKEPLKRSVKDIIYKEYRKAALLPILVVEVMLLMMYFGITSYVERSTRETLLDEAKNNIVEISSREVRNINQQIKEITVLSEMLQKENTRFFNEPETFGPPKEIPRFETWKNGVHYKVNDNGGSSVWYSSITPFDAYAKQKATKTEGMDRILKLVATSNASIVGVYFNSFDSMCRYYPYLKEVYNVFEYNMDIPKFNFYYLADEKHNPSKKTVWTNVYLDPAGQGWMSSCITPIYAEGKLQGVTGIDVTVDKMLQTILNLKLPWQAGAFLVDENGVILAMPESIEGILGLKELRNQVYHSTVKQDTLKPEEFNLFKNSNPEIADQIKAIWNSHQRVNELVIGDNHYFLTQDLVEETGWRLMVLVDQDKVLQPVHKLDKLTKQTGLLAFSMMILFYSVFFSYLVYKSKKVAWVIATPINQIAEKTSSIMEGSAALKFESLDRSIEEIDQLAKNFSLMADELNMFSQEMEEKVKDRTRQLTLANEQLIESKRELEEANMQMIQKEKMASIGQLAAGVAHEINNPMAFIISNIAQLKKYASKLQSYIAYNLEAIEIVKATASKSENQMVDIAVVAQKLKEVDEERQHLGIDFVLEDMDSLIEDTLEGTNRVKAIVQDLRTFSRSDVQRSMSDINNGLDSVINMIWNEIKFKADLVKDYQSLPLTYCNLGQMNQVFMNLLLNAVHAIEDYGQIIVKTYHTSDVIYVEVRDNGKGISNDIIGKIFDPFFTTKEIGKGTGLGLSISYQIVKNYQGEMKVMSEIGKGTTFVVSIPIVKESDIGQVNQ